MKLEVTIIKTLQDVKYFNVYNEKLSD